MSLKARGYEKFSQKLIKEVLSKLEGTHPTFARFPFPDSPSKLIIIGNVGDKTKDYSQDTEDESTLAVNSKSSMKNNSIFLSFLIPKSINDIISVNPSISFFYRVYPTFREQKDYWEEKGREENDFAHIWKRITYKFDTIEFSTERNSEKILNFEGVLKKIYSDPLHYKEGNLKELDQKKEEKEAFNERIKSLISKKKSPNFDWLGRIEFIPEEFGNKRFITIRLVNTTLGKDQKSRKVKFETFFFNVNFTIKLNKIKPIPFEYEYEYEGRTYEIADSYLRTVNCHASYDLEANTIITKNYALARQQKIVPRIEIEGVGASFAELCTQPIEILEKIAKKMEEYLFRYQEHNRFKTDGNFQKDVNHFEQVIIRFRIGIQCLKENSNALKAFQLLHETFQKACSYGKWRLFQIVFIVSMLPSLVEQDHEHEIAEILHVPTGGGKSEAYFGCVVFLCFLNRLDGKKFGVTAITKFPLRMLSIQQLQRIAHILIWSEQIRKEHSIGGEPFSLGYFVGNRRAEFPRYARTLIKKLQKVHAQERRELGVIIDTCPLCDGQIFMNYDNEKETVFHECVNCNRIFPIYLSDEEIYRYIPTLIVSTVDKLAGIALNRRFKCLIGGYLDKCKKHGYLPRNDKCDNSDSTCDRSPVIIPNPIHGPELIIQDEMHLLSEGFGTINCHFESLYDIFVKDTCGWNLKYIGMTATISGVSDQVKHLYHRDSLVFPGQSPFGIGKNDFFYETIRHSNGEDQIQRFLIGLKPNLRDNQYASLLSIRYVTEYIQECERNVDEVTSELEIDTTYLVEMIDNYKRLLTYHYKKADVYSMEFFIRDVASSKLKEYDIIPKTLTGDNSLHEIRELIHYVENFTVPPYSNKNSTLAVFATSVVSHGVDIEAWNILVFQGMPKKTAEYIQALSRIGRKYVGIVFLWFYPNRMRDLSYYHRFNDYSQILDRKVERVPISRWSPLGLDQTFTSLFCAGILNYMSNILKTPIYKVDQVKETFEENDNKETLIEFLRRAYIVTSKMKGSEDFNERIPVYTEDRLNYLFQFKGFKNKNFFPNALKDNNDKYYRTQYGMRGIGDTIVLQPDLDTQKFLLRTRGG